MSKPRIYLTKALRDGRRLVWLKSHVERQNVYCTAHFSLGHMLNVLNCKAPAVSLR